MDWEGEIKARNEVMHVQVHAIYMIGTIFLFSFSIFLMKKDFIFFFSPRSKRRN